MFVIRPTIKLAAKLKVTLGELPEGDVLPMADWGVRSFRVGRYDYLIVTNIATLYSVVLPAKGVTNGARLYERIREGVARYFILRADNEAFPAFMNQAMQEPRFERCHDRSLQGSVSNLVLSAQWILAEPDVDVWQVTDVLNRTPMSAIGMDSPGRRFARLVAQGKL